MNKLLKYNLFLNEKNSIKKDLIQNGTYEYLKMLPKNVIMNNPNIFI